MGAAGNVDLYDFEAVDTEHRKAHGKPIGEDWTYLGRGLEDQAKLDAGSSFWERPPCVVRLLGRLVVVRYWDDQGGHDSADEFWCEDGDAHHRVLATLGKVGSLATCEVWT